MHIDNTYLTNRTLGQADQPAAAKSAAAGGQPPPAASTHVPSPELLDLLDQVRQTPEVRKEVLQRVAQRLANGDYLTHEAAIDTAEAIQKAQE
ncbi:MAG TPA: hypothetical protein VKA46_39070 [Gemmataceae bacterium]|nr:hypothetical protein [Gemmataceae bacterium]